MKKLLLPLLALATLSAGALTLAAQPAVKLVTVDMAKVFDSHYKSEEANVKFANADKRTQEQVEELKKQGQTLVDEYKELIEQAKNTLLTAEARTKAEADAAKKYEEIQRKQSDIQTFVQNTQRTLQQLITDHRERLLEEISKIVIEIARKHEATLVIDKSGPSIFKIPVVLYSDPAYDITAEVIVQENKDRPPAPAAAAPVPAPGAPAPKPAAPKPATPEAKK